MTATSVYAFEDFELDPTRLELRRASQPVRLNQLSLRLLSALVQSAGRVVTKEELLERVWEGRAVSDNVITVAITRLRKSLEQQGGRGLIANVHGLGYRFAPTASVAAASTRSRQATDIGDRPIDPP